MCKDLKIVITALLCLLSLCLFSQNKPEVNEISFRKRGVLRVMKRVADWQLKDWKVEKPKRTKSDWINATGYTGILALYEVSGDKKYLQKVVEIGNTINWQIGPNHFFADDYCIGQTYSILYARFRDPRMIASWKTVADSIVNQPHDESLAWKNKIQLREWAWCDALFMGPPALAYLSTATGDQKYLNKAHELWWKTTSYLYSNSQHLYFRDSTFFTRKELNGSNVFWSRGNGWVLAGLVRLLQNMPASHPDRIKFEKLYKDMMSKIISLQQADGSWHASLLDPKSYPTKETSGTGFYCYALLWGLNNGLMRKEGNIQVVKRAWTALASSVMNDGKLGFVQPVGSSPAKVTGTSTEPYGVGAFLLAGAELVRFIKYNKINLSKY